MKTGALPCQAACGVETSELWACGVEDDLRLDVGKQDCLPHSGKPPANSGARR